MKRTKCWTQNLHQCERESLLLTGSKARTTETRSHGEQLNLAIWRRCDCDQVISIFSVSPCLRGEKAGCNSETSTPPKINRAPAPARIPKRSPRTMYEVIQAKTGSREKIKPVCVGEMNCCAQA